MKLSPCLLTQTKINSNQIKDTSIKDLKLLGENISRYGHSDEFSKGAPLTQEITPRTDKRNPHTIKRFLITKETITRMKTVYRLEGSINHTSGGRSTSGIYKEKKVNESNQTIRSINGLNLRDSSQYLKCSSSSTIRGMQIKIVLRSHLIPSQTVYHQEKK